VGMTAQLALPAAVGFGIADFAGGLATRRASGTLAVIAVAQFAGAAALLPALILLPGRPSAAAAGVGALAGLAGSCGLVWYFRGLARGPMGVVAPLSALTSAGLPLVVGVTAGESTGPVTVCGVAVALLAIALATVGTRRDRAATGGLLLGIGSGVGFGVFFVALNATPPDSGLWPLLAAKVASVVVFGSLLLARRGPSEATPTCSAAARLHSVAMLGLPRADSTWMTVPRLTPDAAASASMVIRRCWRNARTFRPTAAATSSGSCMRSIMAYYTVNPVEPTHGRPLESNELA